MNAWRNSMRSSKNVIAILPGTERPDEVVMHTAHWDHLGRCDAVDGDDTVTERDGVRLVVDSVSLDLVRGASVDYVESLGGAAFRVENPQAASGCGCGSSFAV